MQTREVTKHEALRLLAGCIASCPTKHPDELTPGEEAAITGGPWDYYTDGRGWDVVDNSDDLVQFRPFESLDDAIRCVEAAGYEWSFRRQDERQAAIVIVSECISVWKFYDRKTCHAEALCVALLSTIGEDVIRISEGLSDEG